MAGGGASPIRAILLAFAANGGIAIAKGAAAVYTGSSAMLAEAIHSIADAMNQLLLLLGIFRARRPPDAEHPLGYGKVTFFWSFVVAILLFSLGGLFSLHEGWYKLQHPGSIENTWVALLVLGVSIALEGGSMVGCLHEVRKVRHQRSLWRWFNESRSSELIVVFAEDTAALVGLGAAFGFVALAALTGESRYDAFGSIFIGLLLVMIAIFLAVRVKSLLIGRSADPEVTRAIETSIAGDDAIEEVFHVITVQVGSGVMVAAKVRMVAGLGLAEACERLNHLEARLREQIPEIQWSFMEPDLRD